MPYHIWEEILDIESVSTINVLDKAILEGIEVLNIVDVNCEEELAKLEASDETKANIRNATAKGLIVIIPKDNVTIGDWTGEGYIVMNPNTGEAEYLLYGDVNKSINGGISGFVIGISLIVALFVTPLLIAALAYGVEFLFELYAIGMIDEFVLVFGLYCLGEVADEIKTDWEIFVLYYRAMHGDEEAEAELKHYANSGAVKDAVRKALENIKDALGIATDLVEDVLEDFDDFDGDEPENDAQEDNNIEFTEAEINNLKKM